MTLRDELDALERIAQRGQEAKPWQEPRGVWRYAASLIHCSTRGDLVASWIRPVMYGAAQAEVLRALQLVEGDDDGVWGDEPVTHDEAVEMLERERRAIPWEARLAIMSPGLRTMLLAEEASLTPHPPRRDGLPIPSMWALPNDELLARIRTARDAALARGLITAPPPDPQQVLL